MTLPTDTAIPPRIEYVENGVTAVHLIPFKFIDADDIAVLRLLEDGTELLLVQPTDYSVQGGGYDVGQITKVNGGTAGAVIRIDRNTKRSQPLDLIDGDDFSEEGVEHALDRLTMIVQELKRDQLSAEQVRDIIAAFLKPGDGIELDHDDAANTLTIINTYNAEFIFNTIRDALLEGSNIELAVNNANNTITISSTGSSVGQLADCLLLSGDQQGGGDTGTGDGTFAERVREIMFAALVGVGIGITQNDVANTITLTNTIDAEFVRDAIGAAFVEGAGIDITVNDAGDQIIVTATGAGVTLEDVRDMLAAALVPGTNIQIVPNDGGDQIVIGTNALDASYRGIIPGSIGVDFGFSDLNGGRGILWTGAAGIATIRLESAVPLSAGWVTRIRNKGTGNLSIVRDAGVALFKNGSTVNAGATLAPGGTATLERWAADEFTITGPGVS